MVQNIDIKCYADVVACAGVLRMLISDQKVINTWAVQTSRNIKCCWDFFPSWVLLVGVVSFSTFHFEHSKCLNNNIVFVTICNFSITTSGLQPFLVADGYICSFGIIN